MSRKELAQWVRQSLNCDAPDDDLVPPNQIVLVGGNLLPLRVALAALAPERVAFLVAEGPADKGWEAFLNQCGDLGIRDVQVRSVRDPFDPRCTARTMRDVLADWDGAQGSDGIGLHYTGGTKPMTTGALQALMNRELERRVSRPWLRTYLEGGSDVLRFDEVDPKYSLRAIPMSLSDLLALHGLQAQPPADPAADRRGMADAVAGAAFDRGNEGWVAYRKALPPWDEVESNDLTARALGEELSRDQPDGLADRRLLRATVRAAHGRNYKAGGAFADWSFKAAHMACKKIPEDATWDSLVPWEAKARPDKKMNFLVAGWFEEHLAGRMAGLQDAGGHPLFREVEANVQLSPSSTRPDASRGLETEVDVLAIAGHRPVVVSCTVAGDEDRALVKQKSLEVRVRSNQLGGDLSRVVMASFAGPDRLPKLWDELSTHFPGYDLHRVLGYAHYRGERAFTHRDSIGREVDETLEEMFQTWFH